MHRLVRKLGCRTENEAAGKISEMKHNLRYYEERVNKLEKLLKKGFDLIDDGMPLIHEDMQHAWIGVESWRDRVEELEL